MNSMHPALRNPTAASSMAERTVGGEPGSRWGSGGDDMLAAGAGQRSEYERLRKSPVGAVGMGRVPLGEMPGRSRSKLLLRKKGGRQWGRVGGV